MKAFPLLLALFIPACLDEPLPADAEADQASTVVQSRCPDQTSDVLGTPQQCIVPGGGLGFYPCTDHLTLHFVPLVDTMGKLHCIYTSTTTRTTCDTRICFP